MLDWRRVVHAEHQNQKPLGMISTLMAAYAGHKSLILDPFCGSGTTLVAARDLGHAAIGVELEERYCEIAAKRLLEPRQTEMQVLKD